MKPGRVYGDVETFTRLPGSKPLEVFGAYRYSVDPSTGFNSAVLAWGGNYKLFPYGSHEELAHYIRWFLENTKDKFVFHYALFELAMIQNKLGIAIPPSRVIDTYAKLGYYGLPRSLDDGAKALNCSTLKDLIGKSVMEELAKGLWTPQEKPDEFARLYQYNTIDVQATIEIDEALADMPDEVQRQWEVDTTINMRGIPLDLQAVNNALYLKDRLKEIANQRIATITGGRVVTVGQVKQIQSFAAGHGVNMVDCTADTVHRLLTSEIPQAVREVLELRQEEGLSSLGKYNQMANRQVNGRLYHEFDNYGCTTGRPKGRGVQVLNLPRTTEADRFASLLSDLPDLIPLACRKPSTVVKEALRGVIKASPGHVLVGGDLSQIEARCTGWSAYDHEFLSLFTSGDPYCTYGKNLWGREITKADMIERTAAKATVLSMGFGGGIGAYQRSAEAYKLDMDLFARNVLPNAAPAELEKAYKSYHKIYLKGHPNKPLTEAQGMAADIAKQRYRRDFPTIGNYWHKLWDAFINGGQAGPVYVEKKGNLRILYLPSGRALFYHDVRYHRRKQTVKVDDLEIEVEEVESRWSYQARDRRKNLWYGVVIENTAQGENHDISTWYMRQAEENIGHLVRCCENCGVVHECYDEFTLEVPKAREDWAREQLAALTKTQPKWTKTPTVLPIEFEIWSGERYG